MCVVWNTILYIIIIIVVVLLVQLFTNSAAALPAEIPKEYHQKSFVATPPPDASDM